MLNTPLARRGMVTAPHHLASEAGLRVLRDGGNAVEAMVAMAATIAVVYPHMTSLGGDGFWLISVPGQEPIGIDACGPAAAAAGPELYRGYASIPSRGPLAANTVAGTVSGWGVALDQAKGWGQPLSLDRLLEDAIHYAREGVPATVSQSRFATEKLEELQDVSGFADVHLPRGRPPAPRQIVRQPALAYTLTDIAREGPDGFYRGALAARIAADLERAGSPVRGADLASYRAHTVKPLSVSLRSGRVYNLPPPTQGLASLIILGLFDRLDVKEDDGLEHLHGIVEATKLAFRIRAKHCICPSRLTVEPASFLTPDALKRLVSEIDPENALPWPEPSVPGDTIWMGAIDGQGRAVSFIQSIYWEFGSGVVLRDTGLMWQNRGSSFSLDPSSPNRLEPGCKPFHTLNPALAHLADGRTLVYGTMGGEGQPQTQAAIYTRHVMFGQPLQAAITGPRWLLGRTWGAESTTLKIENRFSLTLMTWLAGLGHQIEIMDGFCDIMGHAGAVSRHPDGVLEGATDPRSDGAAMGF